jgi:hypothetical protein
MCDIRENPSSSSTAFFDGSQMSRSSNFDYEKYHESSPSISTSSFSVSGCSCSLLPAFGYLCSYGSLGGLLIFFTLCCCILTNN